MCDAAREERQTGDVDDGTERHYERETRFGCYPLSLERVTGKRDGKACRARSKDDAP